MAAKVLIHSFSSVAKSSRGDPFSGCLFVFRSRSATSIRVLAYD